MKFRSRFLCGVLACAMLLSGCSAGDDPAGSATTTAASTTTTTAASVTTTMNGEYEADNDGLVEGNVEAGDSDDIASDLPNTGIITDEGDKDKDIADGTTSAEGTAAIADEAAFASSYIDMTAFSQSKTGWGLGKDRDSDNRPVDAVRAEERYSPLGGRFLAEEGRICLTFDEGYENGYTASILDTLKEKGVKAVFFVTYDYCLRSPELVRRMIDEGHTVGNHTKTHPSMPDCSERQMTEEVMFLHEYVKENFGYEMTLFRFPMGEFSEHALEVVNSLGYTSLFWSFAYNDWNTESQPDPTEALEKIEASSHSGIYLLHAVSRTNAAILGELLDYWKNSGYEVGARL